MKIHGLTVCVDYADRLEKSAERWIDGLDSLTVVTDLNDQATVALAANIGCRLYQTNVFYEHGAAFNKGAAIEGGRVLMPWTDWVLFFDADILPPKDWKRRVIEAKPQPGNLYGCHRTIDGKRVSGDGIGVGFFQLFHSTDPIVSVPDGEDLIDTRWKHAANYDNAFMHRWPDERIRDIGFDVEHIGETGNWGGLKSGLTADAIRAERAMRGGVMDHERIGFAAETIQARGGPVPRPHAKANMAGR